MGIINFVTILSISFFTKRKSNDIKFASLQSAYAKSVLPENNINVSEFETIFFATGWELYDRSSAILKICSPLKALYSLGKLFLIVPKFIRDFIYKLISKNRHKIFAKKVTCRIPNSFEKSFFIDKHIGNKLKL
mgnify:CR=1 FL=1